MELRLGGVAGHRVFSERASLIPADIMSDNAYSVRSNRVLCQPHVSLGRNVGCQGWFGFLGVNAIYSGLNC
jgi:hypothetical protein